MIRLGLLLGFTILSVGAAGWPLPASAAPYERILSLESRRSLGDGELAAYLASSDERVAVRAALAIGRTKDAAGEALLVPYLHDRRSPVRAMSLYAVGLLATGDQQAALFRSAYDPAGAVRVAQ